MRALTIFGGFSLAALTVTVLLAATTVLLPPEWPNISEVHPARALRFFGAIWLVIELVTIAPAYIAIEHAEASRIRGARFYVLAGAGVGIFLWAVVVGLVALGGYYSEPSGPGTNQTFRAVALSFLIFAAHGLAAGLVYWAVAGRKAGYPDQESAVPSR